MLSKLLTEQEVADLVGVSIHAVKKWRDRDLIVYVKIGKIIRFEQTEVEDFIQRNKKGAACVSA